MSCQHSGCQCEEASVARGNKMFCSENCAERESSGRHVSHCDCGHASCDAAVKPAAGSDAMQPSAAAGNG